MDYMLESKHEVEIENDPLDEWKFFKNAEWSPDGSTVLCDTSDKTMRLYDISNKFNNTEDDINTLDPKLIIPRAVSTCSFKWYPYMNIQEDITNCFMVGSTDNPIHLIDGNTGLIRASYPIIDHQENFIGPNCMEFDYTGTKLYCGYLNKIEIIDITREGKSGIKQSTIVSRKSKLGQKGIISSICFSPTYQSYAAGSYSNSIGIYDVREDSGLNQANLIIKNNKLKAVTQIKYLDENVVFAACRRSSDILSFDLRNIKAPLNEIYRKLYSDQRVHFDLNQNYLVTGNQDGEVIITDVNDLQNLNQKIHNDTISSCSYHPNQPWLLTTAGSRFNPYSEMKSRSKLNVWEIKNKI